MWLDSCLINGHVTFWLYFSIVKFELCPSYGTGRWKIKVINGGYVHSIIAGFALWHLTKGALPDDRNECRDFYLLTFNLSFKQFQAWPLNFWYIDTPKCYIVIFSHIFHKVPTLHALNDFWISAWRRSRACSLWAKREYKRGAGRT